MGKQSDHTMPKHLKVLERWANLVWAMGVLSIIGGLIGGIAVGAQRDQVRQFGPEELTHVGDGIAVAAAGVVVGLLLGLAGNFALAWVAEHEHSSS